MASYRYTRNLDPAELLPDAKKKYTRRERWVNWWDYNLKWVILLALAGGFVAYCFIGQYFFVKKADYNVAVVSPYYLPQNTVSALETALAAYADDRNGDGETVVTVNTYTINYAADGDTESETDAYLTMAGNTKLVADVQGAQSSVFILYDPAGFEAQTGTLRYLDGTLPVGGTDGDWWNMVYAWTDCPVLTALPLGSYAADGVQNASGDSQEYLAGFYVGLRGAWSDGAAENLAGSDAFWAALTEGAVSTVQAE